MLEKFVRELVPLPPELSSSRTNILYLQYCWSRKSQWANNVGFQDFKNARIGDRSGDLVARSREKSEYCKYSILAARRFALYETTEAERREAIRWEVGERCGTGDDFGAENPPNWSKSRKMNSCWSKSPQYSGQNRVQNRDFSENRRWGPCKSLWIVLSNVGFIFVMYLLFVAAIDRIIWYILFLFFAGIFPCSQVRTFYFPILTTDATGLMMIFPFFHTSFTSSRCIDDICFWKWFALHNEATQRLSESAHAPITYVASLYIFSWKPFYF